jgi:uncharacterized protein (TIGR02444 family)
VTNGVGRDEAWPASALWDYAVALYASPGVAAACLALQDRRGADVNLLLLACWLGATGREPDAGRIAEVLEQAEAWQEGLVRPLREARRRLKAVLLTLDELLRLPLAAARADLASVELALERGELLVLESVTEDAAADPVRRGRVLAARMLWHLVAISPDDDPALRALLAAAFPESGCAGVTPADPAAGNQT